VRQNDFTSNGRLTHGCGFTNFFGGSECLGACGLQAQFLGSYSPWSTPPHGDSHTSSLPGLRLILPILDMWRRNLWINLTIVHQAGARRLDKTEETFVASGIGPAR
jgi:hypothetical protein